MPDLYTVTKNENFKLTRPDAVVFDMGETLVMRESYDLKAGLKAVFDYVKSDASVDIILETYKAVLPGFVQMRRDETTLEINFRGALRYILEYNGIDMFDYNMAEVELIFTAATFSYTKAPGLDELLDTLERHNIKKAVLSNTWFSGQVLHRDLSDFGLLNRFVFAISSADYCFRKPNKNIFELAIKKLSLLPFETRTDLGSEVEKRSTPNFWYVGDRFQYDVIGSTNAGVTPIWFNHPQKEVPPSFVPVPAYNTTDLDYVEISTFFELTELINSFF
jgi:putative hydrolase of the HAD superfamily